MTFLLIKDNPAVFQYMQIITNFAYIAKYKFYINKMLQYIKQLFYWIKKIKKVFKNVYQIDIMI